MVMSSYIIGTGNVLWTHISYQVIANKKLPRHTQLEIFQVKISLFGSHDILRLKILVLAGDGAENVQAQQITQPFTSWGPRETHAKK